MKAVAQVWGAGLPRSRQDRFGGSLRTKRGSLASPRIAGLRDHLSRQKGVGGVHSGIEDGDRLARAGGGDGQPEGAARAGDVEAGFDDEGPVPPAGRKNPLRAADLKTGQRAEEFPRQVEGPQPQQGSGRGGVVRLGGHHSQHQAPRHGRCRRPPSGPGSPRLPASPRGMERPTTPVPRSPRCPDEVKARLACRCGETRSLPAKDTEESSYFPPSVSSKSSKIPWATHPGSCFPGPTMSGRPVPTWTVGLSNVATTRSPRPSPGRRSTNKTWSSS